MYSFIGGSGVAALLIILFELLGIVEKRTRFRLHFVERSNEETLEEDDDDLQTNDSHRSIKSENRNAFKVINSLISFCL